MSRILSRRTFIPAACACLLFAAGCGTACPGRVSRATDAMTRPYELNRAGCRIGVLADCDSEYLSRKMFDRAEIVPYDDPRAAVRHLLTEKIDGFVFDEHVLRLAQWHYPDRFRILETPIDTDPSVIAVSVKRPDLQAELNRFIAAYRKDGTYDAMFLRWCHDPERRPEDVPPVKKILYTGADARPLRVGVDPVQEPNAFIDAKGRLVGFDIEFAYRFGRYGHYRIELVQESEQELLRRLAAGKLDVVVANLGRDDRSDMLWTDGYLDSDIMMMVKVRGE